jgi:hypothetical protein
MPATSQPGSGLSAQKSGELRLILCRETRLLEQCAPVSDSSDISDSKAVCVKGS